MDGWRWGRGGNKEEATMSFMAKPRICTPSLLPCSVPWKRVTGVACGEGEVY